MPQCGAAGEFAREDDLHCFCEGGWRGKSLGAEELLTVEREALPT
jgi:hypothetical protein